MELNMKNFNIVRVHGKIWFLGGGGGVLEKPICRGRSCLKRWLGQYADLRGGLAKIGVVFLRGIDTPLHTMLSCSTFRLHHNFPAVWKSLCYVHLHWTLTQNFTHETETEVCCRIPFLTPVIPKRLTKIETPVAWYNNERKVWILEK